MLNSVISAILAVFILGEPWRLPEFAATFISLMGAVLVTRPTMVFGGEGTRDPLGVAYALIAAGKAHFLLFVVKFARLTIVIVTPTQRRPLVHT